MENEDGVEGTIPEFGAIFMSNIATKRECLKRKIFGLPSAQASFVKQVKEGMMLFLFEFETRKLFGVFRATSDGAMNIVPHAFSSSGKKFPAQVRFAPIWYCNPLSESEFRDAIRDNYYSAKKFNFGLSKNQLFDTRRLNNKMPWEQSSKKKKITRQVGKDGQRVQETSEHHMGEYRSSATLDDYSDNSLDRGERVYDDRFMMGDRVENEHKVDSGPQRGIWTDDDSGDYWTKGRKIDNDCRFSMSDVTESELFNDCGHFLGKMRRAADNVSLSPGARVKDYRLIDNNFGPSTSTEPINSFNEGRRVTEDDRFLMNERVENEYEKRFSEGRLALDDSRCPRTMYSGGNELSVENCIGPVFSTEQIGNSLGKVARATDDASFLMSKRVEKDCHISGKHLGNTFRRAADDGTFLIRDRIDSEQHGMDNGFGPLGHFGPGSSTEFSRYSDGKFRESDRVENVHDMDSGIGPAFSSCITTFSQSDRKTFTNSNLESDSFFRHDQLGHSSEFPSPNRPQVSTQSFSTSHDSVVTRHVPYDPEFPNIRYRSSPLVVNHDLKSVQEQSSQQGYVGNFLSSTNSKGLANPFELERSVASGNGSKDSFFNISHHRSDYGTSKTFLNAGYPKSSELRTSPCESYKGSLADSFLASLSFPNGRSFENVNVDPLSYASSSSKYPSFAFDDGYSKESQGIYDFEIPHRESNEKIAGKRFAPSDAALLSNSRLHFGSLTLWIFFTTTARFLPSR